MFVFFLKQFYGTGAPVSGVKYFSRWKNSLKEGASSVRDEQPWITFPVIDKLDAILTKSSCVFEYGGGGSTLFFANRVKEVITVEHNKEWYAILTKIVKDKSIANWNGNLIEAGTGDLFPQADKANPDHYSSGDQPSKGKNYADYVKCIDKYEDNSFDLVSVDGRSRPSCIKHAIPKIKKGGYLLLDNSDRSYYLSFFKEQLKKEFTVIIDEMGPSPYSKYFTKTSIWKKN